MWLIYQSGEECISAQRSAGVSRRGVQFNDVSGAEDGVGEAE